MKRFAAAIMVSVITATSAMMVPTPAQATERFSNGLPAAQYEDACAHGVKRCVWDGHHQGNGVGRSYILTRHPGDFSVNYIRHRRAHRLQALWCARPTVNCGYGE